MSALSFSSQRKRNSALKSPTPYHLRALVLDYLCHQCYTNTARAFIRDSTVKELDADGDEILGGLEGCRSGSSSDLPESLLQQVENRREIREHILAGRVDEATTLLNRYFPSVLSDSSAETGSNPGKAACTSSSSNNYAYISATSVEPAHLLLNLRILAFTEACRTRPLEYPLGKGSTQPPAEDEAMNTSEHPSAPAGSGEPSTSDEDTNGEMNPEQQAVLLGKAQKLYILVNNLLAPTDREIYTKELRNVAGLLAYKIPEASTVSKYLSYERREAVADQVNRAILHRCGLPPVPSIELLVRYTTAVWHAAKAHGQKPRPGIVLPPTSSSRSQGTSSKPEPESDELPLFDLRQFLDARP